MWQTNFCLENYWKKLDKKKQTKLKIQRDLPLRQWVFGELRSKEKQKAKRCESSIWLRSPPKAMTILKAVAKRLRRKKNVSTVLWEWEKEAKMEFIFTQEDGSLKSVRVSLGSLVSPHKVIGEPETSNH